MPTLVMPADSNRPALLTIPTECRIEILRCLLLTSRTRRTKWLLEEFTTTELSQECDRNANISDRMLGAPARYPRPFDRVLQGLHRQTIVYDLTPAILRVCKTLLAEGLEILYTENEWCALKWDGIGRLQTGHRVDMLKVLGVKNKWVMDTNDFDALRKGPKNHSRTLASSVKLTMDVAVDQSEEVRLLPMSDFKAAIRALYLAFVVHDQVVANPSSVVAQVQGNGLLEPSHQGIFLLRHVVTTLASHIEDVFIGGKSLFGCNEGSKNMLPTSLKTIKGLCDADRKRQFQGQVIVLTMKVRDIEIAPRDPALVEATALQLLSILAKLYDMAEAHVGTRPACYAYPQAMKLMRGTIVVASWHLAHLDIPVASVALLRHQLLVAHDILHLKNLPVSGLNEPKINTWRMHVDHQISVIKYKLGRLGIKKLEPIKEEKRLKVSVIE